ncbi:MAG: DUF3179 domain-containing protein [Alphaproteobacteria bacterium]|nr:DUF3179 domain-containing protein [Alphaproteobacteria bacterium]
MAAVVSWSAGAYANPGSWAGEWPRTDFAKASIDFNEILSGGPPKDGIPAIDRPLFAPVEDVAQKWDFGDEEPVITVAIDGDLKAYPLRVLMWHEIVNDTIGGVPIAVTYCPLCNSSVVFDRRVGDLVLDFGTTGKLRNSDLVMYDRQTESWWQQFLGEAIVGEMTGTMLDMIPVRVESFEKFRARGSHGKVLVPNNRGLRTYGGNPYERYDSRSRPYPFFQGEMPDGIPPLQRVVAVGNEAWSVALLREVGELRSGDLILTWEAGQNSALDTSWIAEGRDVGNVVVQRETGNGREDVVHDITFAFAFHAFRPEGTIHVR